ncbi:11472_t:CDS:2 [Dentiscutata erythropus]|uniref:11472_t:CDS:1 n=1 Tax=Dentiscutata erythropus TaxID=1348616 RepID=A0A9N9IRP4_9GLOM|nr:11472_t:CDS:2 [Dentiscutata erythropus]
MGRNPSIETENSFSDLTFLPSHQRQIEVQPTYFNQAYNNSFPIQQTYIYNPTAYPSPPLDNSINLPSPRVEFEDNNRSMNSDNSNLTSSSSTGFQMDRRMNLPIALLQQVKLEPGSSEGSPETWSRVSAPETSGTTHFPFGSYSAKPVDERAMNPAFQQPMGYYGQPQHPVNFGNTMPPTPQDYPMQNQNRNVTHTTPLHFHQNQSRPPPVLAPQTMMTTFSSKTVSSTPKRYKCNICQKRFTRPSSLQTHTYSHTGEKLIQLRNTTFVNTTFHSNVQLKAVVDTFRLSVTFAVIRKFTQNNLIQL